LAKNHSKQVLLELQKILKKKRECDNRTNLAIGSSGYIKEIVVVKAGHKARLVIKKYIESEVQTKNAVKDFTMLSFLKKKGYPVPPTIRLIERKGKKFVVMTDLTKYGDQIAKYIPKNRGTIHTWFFENLVASIGKKNALEIRKQIEFLTNKAREEQNINISDAFEIVVDSKKRKAIIFLVDVDHAVRKRKDVMIERRLKEFLKLIKK
jgi:predicted HAD superfamily phosphohydrolase